MFVIDTARSKTGLKQHTTATAASCPRHERDHKFAASYDCCTGIPPHPEIGSRAWQYWLIGIIVANRQFRPVCRLSLDSSQETDERLR
ncbi:hypothetical protein D8S78_16545 [Natrialba swarupiae]|nr:hypothetical protein [Natrialba swarupiae]